MHELNGFAAPRIGVILCRLAHNPQFARRDLLVVSLTVVIGCSSQSRTDFTPPANHMIAFIAAVPAARVADLPVTQCEQTVASGDLIGFSGRITVRPIHQPPKSARIEFLQERVNRTPIIMARKTFNIDPSGYFSGTVKVPARAGEFSVQVVSSENTFLGRSKVHVKK